MQVRKRLNASRRKSRAALLLSLLLLGACAGRPKKSADPWTQWHQMQLPVEIASARVASTQARIFTRFQKQVQAQNYAKAIGLLQDPGLDPQGEAWAKILLAQLAGLHTRACEGGQWLYFADPKKASAPRVSMLTLLDKLDPLRDSPDKSLATQAKTAATRVMVIARDCPGAASVQERAKTELPALLAELADTQAAALPPDLAYLWATIHLEKEQWSKARHWLKVAADQGLHDPRITLAQAQAHYGQGHYEQARAQAIAGAKAIPKDFARPIADAWALAAKSSWALGKTKLASKELDKSFEADPAHPGAWALLVAMQSAHDEACTSSLPARLEPLWKLPWGSPPTLFWLLDDMLVTLDAQGLAPLSCLATALIWDIDQEQDAALRGIRYFYAATLDTRLGELESALGRALLARTEFESAGSPKHPLPVQALIDALSQAQGPNDAPL